MDNKKIGLFIKKLRLKKGLSQYELADLIHLSRSSISKWETGQNLPDSSILLKLAKIFNVTTNELLLGNLENKDNKNELNNVNLTIYDDRNKQKKKSKVFLIIIFFVCFLFLLYFFITFFNSIRIYDITSSNLKVNGMLIKTKDKIEFNINYLIEDSYETVSLIHQNDNEEKLIVSSNNDYININDYLGYEEYFNFKTYSSIINNLFLEVKFSDKSVERYKLDFDLSYSNNKIFLLSDKNINLENYEKREYYPKQLIDIMTFRNKTCKNNNCYKEINYEKQKYQILIHDDNNIIELVYDNKQYRTVMQYDYLNGKNRFLYKKFKKDILENSYVYIIDNELCQKGDCSDSKIDFEFFLKMLDKIKV